MPKGSPELTAARKEEIMNACEQLYKTKNFKDITLKDIGTVTSFTRTSIYNYFQTKEEIFLGLFKREYEAWCDALKAILESDAPASREELADRIAETLPERELMLKLLAVNLYDMEENSRLELLVDFKKAYFTSVRLMNEIFKKFCSEWNDAERQAITTAVLQFLHGLYPYAHHTEKQEEAMRLAGETPAEGTILVFAKNGLRRLLA